MANFEVDGVEYTLVDSPTFGEAKAIEKASGCVLSAMNEKNQPIAYIQALVWVSMKRVNPEVKFEDLDDLDMGVLTRIQQAQEKAEEESPDPLGPSA